MNSLEKIEYVKNKILEKSLISPNGLFYVDCCDFVDFEGNGGFVDDAIVLISKSEQIDIIKKLEIDGFITFSGIDEAKNGAWVSIDLTKDTSVEKLFLATGILSVNKNTGLVALNNVENIFNPNSDEFNIIYSFFKNKDNRVSYKQLINGTPSKTTIRQLGYKIRNIKKVLGILPLKKAKNKNIFSNIKRYGYNLEK